MIDKIVTTILNDLMKNEGLGAGCAALQHSGDLARDLVSQDPRLSGTDHREVRRLINEWRERNDYGYES